MRFVKMICLMLLTSSVFAATTNNDSTYSEDKTGVMVTSDHSQFTIQLKSNPSTGYSWFLRKFDTDFIQPVKHAYQPAADRKLVGAPGMEVWTFRVKPSAFSMPQQTMLSFVYARPWESSEHIKPLVFTVSTMSPHAEELAQKSGDTVLY